MKIGTFFCLFLGLIYSLYRMKFLLFTLLFACASYAQKDSKFLISLENVTNVEIKSDFYINKIYDGRQIKDNIGTAQKSLFNTKVLTDFKKPFVGELQSFLSICYPKREGKKGIDIRVDELYISEITRSNKETGYATVVFDVIEKNGGKDFIVGNFSATIESSGLDVTSKHSERIIEALSTSFESYKELKKGDRLNVGFSIGDGNLFESPSSIKEGVYINYADLFTGETLDLDNFSITNYNGMKCLLNNKTGRLENGFYGFSDGLNFYINLFRFSTFRLYAKTELLGDYYCIDSVKVNSVDFSALKAMYGGGIVGLLLFPEAYEAEVPLLLNKLNGVPVFLTEKYMVNLLSGNKELYKDYRKTKRTSNDKIAFYKKHFNL